MVILRSILAPPPAIQCERVGKAHSQHTLHTRRPSPRALTVPTQPRRAPKGHTSTCEWRSSPRTLQCALSFTLFFSSGVCFEHQTLRKLPLIGNAALTRLWGCISVRSRHPRICSPGQSCRCLPQRNARYSVPKFRSIACARLQGCFVTLTHVTNHQDFECHIGAVALLASSAPLTLRNNKDATLKLSTF